MVQIKQGDPYNPEVYLGNVPRADFRTEKFDTIIKQKGYTMIWEQATICSCYNPTDGQPQYQCPDCHGRGYYYFGAVETKAVVSSINGHREQEEFGLINVGSAYITPLSTDMVGYRDRFTFTDFRVKFSEIITRGTTNTDNLRYPADKVLAIRSLGQSYKPGIDLTLSQDGKSVTWVNVPSIVNGQYSILYTTPPVYICINPVHEMRGTYVKYHASGQEEFVILPQQYQMKREDFLDGDTSGFPPQY